MKKLIITSAIIFLGAGTVFAANTFTDFFSKHVAVTSFSNDYLNFLDAKAYSFQDGNVTCYVVTERNTSISCVR